MQQSDPPFPSMQTVDAVVIGGGVSGLAIANVLARQGKRVHLIERSKRLGGAVRTIHKEGFLCEAGPNSMLVKSEPVWDYLHELGLGERIVEANPVSNKRFLVKRGKVVPLPMSPMGGVTTPLYSVGEKFRLLQEPFIKPTSLEDESVTSFVSRRMGPAFLEYGISALVSGIFAGDPDRLSLRYAFPKVWNLEQNYGSLIGGALKLKRERKRQGVTPFKSRMISFRKGLQELVETLARGPNLTTELDTALESISRNADGKWFVQTSGDGVPVVFETEQLILATPLDAYQALPFDEDVKDRLATIEIPHHPPLSTLVLGFDRDQVEHPLDGFGVLFPRKEKRFCLGAIFSSTLFPGRAPEDKVALMCFIGGVQQPRNGELPTVSLVDQTLQDLRPLLGINGIPVFSHHTFWPRAIPQYDVGHGQFLHSLHNIESAFPGLHLRGNFRGGPGLNDCLEGALNFQWGRTSR